VGWSVIHLVSILPDQPGSVIPGGYLAAHRYTCLAVMFGKRYKFMQLVADGLLCPRDWNELGERSE